jgi:hypothetical protein
MASLVKRDVLCKIIDMPQVYKTKKALIAPMLLAVILSIPVFVDVILSGFATKMLIMAIPLMVLFYLFALNNLIKRVLVDPHEIVIKSLFGSIRIGADEITRIDGITMGSRQFITLSTKKRSHLIPNSFDNFPGIIDSIRGMAPGETIGEGLEQLRENVVNRKSDITMSWITVILLAIIILIRFFPR